VRRRAILRGRDHVLATLVLPMNETIYLILNFRLHQHVSIILNFGCYLQQMLVRPLCELKRKKQQYKTETHELNSVQRPNLLSEELSCRQWQCAFVTCETSLLRN
jgi:hypothetical protein